MKVLHIFNSIMPSGAETMWTAAAPILRKEGIETHVAATLDEIGPYVAEMKSAGFKVFHFPHCSSKLLDIKYCINLYRHIRNNRYDAVQIHPEAWRLTNAIICKLAKTRQITTTIHNNFALHGIRFWLRVLRMRLIVRLGVIVVTIGESVFENEVLYHYKPYLVHNWINPSKFRRWGNGLELRKQLGIGENSKVLAIVGNCSPIKNHAFILQVLAKLPEKFMLLHIGQEDADMCERMLAERFGIIQRVRFLGRRQDVSRLLEGADIFVMCSLHEGLSIALLEGLMKGLPAIVSDVPGLREMAYLPLCIKTPLDETAFAEKIVEVAGWSVEERLQRASETSKRIETDYSMQMNVGAYIHLWRQKG